MLAVSKINIVSLNICRYEVSSYIMCCAVILKASSCSNLFIRQSQVMKNCLCTLLCVDSLRVLDCY